MGTTKTAKTSITAKAAKGKTQAIAKSARKTTPAARPGKPPLAVPKKLQATKPATPAEASVKVAAAKTTAPSRSTAKSKTLLTTREAAAAKPPVATKPPKIKKAKLVRDSFTIPQTEFDVLDALKKRAAKLMCPIKKSELLRAGIKAIAALPDQAFVAALLSVPTIKTGRPKSES
jgi:hypothetical protein